jgi:GNAT superfamily N-acetyltransferase
MKPAAIAVRLARPDDLPGLEAVERSASTLFAGTHLNWVLDAEPFPAEMLRTAQIQGLAWVAEAGRGRVVGFIVATDQRPSLFIEELSVAASHQRRGIGRQLLEAALRHAATCGYASVTLTTDRDLPWNRRFYEAEGFRVLEAGEMSHFLADRLSEEAKYGHEPARRCAMWRAARPGW